MLNQKEIDLNVFVNENTAQKAIAGDICTFKVPFRIRLSDKIYKIIE